MRFFKLRSARALRRTEEGWLVSQPGSEYFFLMVPFGVVFAIIPWILLVKFSASFGVGVVGALPAGMVSYAYVKWAVSMFRIKRVRINRSHLSVSRFGNSIKLPVDSIVRIKTKEMRIVSVYFNDGLIVYFLGMPGYNVFDDKTSFERILEFYDS